MGPVNNVSLVQTAVERQLSGAPSGAGPAQRLCSQLHAWAECSSDSKQPKNHEALRRGLETFTHSHQQAHFHILPLEPLHHSFRSSHQTPGPQ